MRSKGSFARTPSATIILALVIAAGAAPSFSPIERGVAGSYRSAVRVYERARMWGVIARWWIDPEYVPSARDEQRVVRFENVCLGARVGARVTDDRPR